MNENIIEVTMEPQFDEYAIINKFQELYTKSKDRFANLYTQMKRDRDFLIDDNQWSKSDGAYVSKRRNRMVMNVIGNQVEGIVNSYSAWPFRWYTGNQDDDVALEKFADLSDAAVQETLHNSVSIGLGIFAVGNDERGLPSLYSISDFNRVVLDPDFTSVDGDDMTECALIDYRGRRWVELNYGPEFLPDERESNIVPCKRDLVPIITYYVLEQDGCHVYTLVNRHAFDNGIMPIARIPVFPVFGERNFDRDGEMGWSGVVAKTRSIQKLVNLSVTQLGERLALSPKAQWLATADAVKGLDNYYKHAGSGENNLIPWNRKTDDQKEELQAPQRFDPQVQFADLSGIIGNTLSMMSSVTGVDSRGLIEQNHERTATEVNLITNSFQNQVRHYMQHLCTSYKAAGRVLATLAGIEGEVDVCQGPTEWAGMQQARAEITALIAVAEPNQKPALLDALIQTYPDNRVMGNLYAKLHSLPTPTPMEAQMQQVCEQMKQQIMQQQQQMAQMDQQIKYYELQQNDNKNQIQLELTKMQYQHQAKMEEMALQAQLEGNVGAAQVEQDAAKAQIEIEKEAMNLELARRKAEGELAVGAAKNRVAVEKANIDLAVNRAKAAASVQAAQRKAEKKDDEVENEG